MRFRYTGKQVERIIGCAVFCLTVAAITFLNRTLIMEPAAAFLRGGSFQTMKRDLQANLLGDRLRGKDELLTLNGGFARAEGRTEYNKIQTMTNGMLTAVIEEMPDVSPFADNVSHLHRFLERRGIPFLFILAPYKEPVDENLLPPGVTDWTNDIGDEAVRMLRERNVPVLDLRETMSRTREQIETYFYRTDHHWNAEGAFYAYQQIMEAIRARFPDTKTTFADGSLWEKTVLPDWWLGSHGKRVGPLYAGVDDLDYYLPAFETEMARYSTGIWAYKGDFRKANIREWFLQTSDYMRMDHYQRYLGGGYPLTLHRNQRAENQLNLLIYRDSFMLPVECFLSTEFTSVEVLDPREYGAMSEMDYVRLNPPDLVLMMNYPGTLANGYFQDFGLDRELVPVGEAEWGDLTAVVSGETDYTILPAALESGKSYQLTLEDIEVRNGAPEGAMVALYDGDSRLDLTIFDIEYGRAFGYRWGFQIPESGGAEGNYQLRFYAGISPDAEGLELGYRGIRIQTFEAAP
ncbi:MAG: hypothetical protein IKE24_09135 [Clostridia bacterium]|nr:hypothetical protein [Clostridia bacterium]